MSKQYKDAYLRNYKFITMSEINSFAYIKAGLKGSKTCTYLRKWLHANSLSKKKQKEKATTFICLVDHPPELAWYLVLLGPRLKNLRNYKVNNSVNDHIIQVVGWSVQSRKRSFIM